MSGEVRTLHVVRDNSVHLVYLADSHMQVCLQTETDCDFLNNSQYKKDFFFYFLVLTWPYRLSVGILEQK